MVQQRKRLWIYRIQRKRRHFVHYSAIKLDGYKTLTEGQFVEFNLVETPKGYQALDVVVIKEATPAK